MSQRLPPHFELDYAQRLRRRADAFVYEAMPLGCSDADLQSATVLILTRALEMAQGIDRDEPTMRKTSLGPPSIDWEKLTGKSLDALIYEVRIEAIHRGYKSRIEAERLGGDVPNFSPPWFDVCKSILDQLREDWTIDESRLRAAQLAEHLKPSNLKKRYGKSFDGWKIDSRKGKIDGDFPSDIIGSR